MFTGIVQGIAQIIDIKDKTELRTYTVRLPESMTKELELGASIANDGCCLTITKVEKDLVSFDLMSETLNLTTLGCKKVNDYVNVERAARFNDEIGGHLMSGHIACTAKIVDILETDNNWRITFELPEQFAKYVLYKGFIGIDGISLTVGNVTNNCFNVHLIPETLERTTIGRKQMGEYVNIEIDPQTQAVVDTVERVMQQKGL
ncbi:riboflavin synthase subunit alpha [Zophobihabitans entericus]|uniref:Riboflavin synthase n=1 Tax=Zophobihabitans entericus TaxID=1635327 RepID=A0A6G9IBU3_9GAMM|nr:riboflavin synthase subunit alpha [Zophobihabitans entericus]QIQ21050.1 riboflavin synthase subunit alpha [Zophobihabitans entericus]